MTRLIGWTEALLLILLGLFMITLAGSDNYWLLLNPKFRWVTALGGLGICLAGTGLFFVPAERPGPARIAVMLFFVALLVAWNPEDAFLLPGGDPFSGGTGEPEQSRVVVNGREYIRINTAELYQLASQEDPERIGLDYVVQGVCRRTPELDARGEIVLLRVAVSCCLADAVGMGVRVAVEDPEKFTDGIWLRAYGRLEKRPPAEERIRDLKIKGVFLTVVSESHVLAPDEIEAVAQPGLPFLFDIRQAEPYAY
jgi:hypothetical protein